MIYIIVFGCHKCQVDLWLKYFRNIILMFLESQNSYRGMQFLSQQHVSQEPNSFYPKPSQVRLVSQLVHHAHTHTHIHLHFTYTWTFFSHVVKNNTLRQIRTHAPSGCLTPAQPPTNKQTLCRPLTGAHSARVHSHKKPNRVQAQSHLEIELQPNEKPHPPALTEELPHQPTKQRECVRMIIMTDDKKETNQKNKKV